MHELHLVRVVARREVADGVVQLVLAGVDAPLPGWTPGAHIDVLLPSGLVRQYSLCGPLAAQDRYEIAVLGVPPEREGRGGSMEVHALRVGVHLKVSAPRNRFPLVPAERFVLVAGGIGITPILPMVEALAQHGMPWHLVYGGRSRSSMAFLDQLDLLDPLAERITLVPQDELGVMDLVTLLAPHQGATVYACGPPPMLDSTAAVVEAWGTGELHLERFLSTRQDDVSVSDAVETASFEIQLGVGGPLLPVAADESILQAVLAAGADVLFSCEEGTCGSCETTVLDGEVSHRDDLLTDHERANGKMLICVSRAASPRLVLDIAAP